MIRAKLRALFLRRRLERELDAELEFHRAMAAENDSPHRFGSEVRIREEAREAWMIVWLEALGQDLRFAWRSMRRTPGSAVAVVAALALGIGANSAIFSLAYAVLWQPLPYPEANRIVQVSQSNSKFFKGSPIADSSRDILTARQQNVGLQDWSIYRAQVATITGTGEPKLLQGAEVEAGVLQALGARPVLGRLIASGDDHPGAPAVVMISARLWRQRWNANPEVIGQTTRLDGKNYTVVGVLPDWFQFPTQYGPVSSWHTAYWTSWQDSLEEGGDRDVYAVARLAPGVTLAEARRRVGAAMQTLAARYPQSDGGWRFDVVPLRAAITKKVAPALWMMLAVVGLVLLIAAANVACLLSARAQRRLGELAMRAALGASRARLLRQLWTETAVLIALGAGTGLALAAGGIAWLRAAAPSDMPRLAHLGMSWSVAGFTALLAIFVMLAFGLAPAWSASGRRLETRARQVRTSGRGVWVVAQVALSLLLLAGAGLMLTAFWRRSSVQLGFHPEHVLSFGLFLPAANYPHRPERWQFVQSARQRLAVLPGVQSVAFGSFLPLYDSAKTFYTLPGQKRAQQMVTYYPVSAGFLRTLQIALLRGRGFTTADSAKAPPVTIISQGLAQELFPGRNPVGQRIKYAWADGPWRTIVGVAANVYPSLGDQPEAAPPTVYVPLAQDWFSGSTYFVLRTHGAALAVLPEVRKAVQRINPQMSVAAPNSLRHIYRGVLARPRFRGWLTSGFALLALVLTALGIFGLLAYSVGQRTQELGLRAALGARPGQVLVMILRQAMALIGIGLVTGLGLAIGLTRYLQGLLYGVSPTNGWILGGVAALIALVGLAAALGPARRAMRVDPARALRCE